MKASANTDNMSKLFPALRDRLSCFLPLLLHSGQICSGCCTLTRSCARNLNSLYLDSFLPSFNIVARHCNAQ